MLCVVCCVGGSLTPRGPLGVAFSKLPPVLNVQDICEKICLISRLPRSHANPSMCFCCREAMYGLRFAQAVPRKIADSWSGKCVPAMAFFLDYIHLKV